ncbi:MAG: MarR family transcriptional regulator [Steroidobacteraceae bacterium]
MQGDHWLQGYVPYLLYRATNKLNIRLLERLRETRTNPSRWRVLSVLKAHGTLNVGEIADHTLTEQSTVSRVIAQLEREGRVIRKTSRKDSRVIRVELTPKGTATFEAILPAALQHQQVALQGIKRGDIQVLVRVLAQIEKNIDEPARRRRRKPT